RIDHVEAGGDERGDEGIVVDEVDLPWSRRDQEHHEGPLPRSRLDAADHPHAGPDGIRAVRGNYGYAAPQAAPPDQCDEGRILPRQGRRDVEERRVVHEPPAPAAATEALHGSGRAVLASRLRVRENVVLEGDREDGRAAAARRQPGAEDVEVV